jgi:hypothetical protein
VKTIFYDQKQLHELLLLHIAKGDRSDGIPNIHSADNTFADKIRQTPITKKIVSKFNLDPEQYCQDCGIIDNYRRNKLLIDFSMIPLEIEQTILEEYKKTKKPKLLKSKTYDFQKHKSSI